MRILFLLFSGTNNTLEIARLLASDFALEGHTSEITNIDIDTPLVDLSNYDLVALGYPIYAFNEPRFFWRYVKRLQLSKKGQVFCFQIFRRNTRPQQRFEPANFPQTEKREVRSARRLSFCDAV